MADDVVDVTALEARITALESTVLNLHTVLSDVNARLSGVVPATPTEAHAPGYRHPSEQGTIHPHRNTPGEV